MRQVDIGRSVGYALKRTTVALRAQMDAVLGPLGLSVPQYACLELLSDRPDQSNAELARGVFVSRQAMHQLLDGLLAARLVAATGHGRAQRFALTAEGQRRIEIASSTVARVEERMLIDLDGPQRALLRAALDACTHALNTTPADEPAEQR